MDPKTIAMIKAFSGGGSGVGVDSTLTIAGKAADAAATGEAIEKLNEEIAPKTHPYRGEKIQLTQYALDCKQIADLSAMVADNHGPQDGCAYGDTYFQFAADGYFGVYKLPEWEYKGSYPLNKRDTIMPHCNSACFSDVFYSSEDLYPLVYVNAYNTTGLPRGTCYVHRILTDGDAYWTELVQTIMIGFVDDELWVSSDNESRPYGNFAIDTKNRHLYAYTLRGADRKTRFFKFNLPNITADADSLLARIQFDANEAIDNSSISQSVGSSFASDSRWITGFLHVKGAAAVNANYSIGICAFYDADKHFIANSSYLVDQPEIVVPTEATYMRLDFAKTNIAFENASQLVLTRIGVGESVVDYDASMAVDNKAIGGKTIVDNESFWITDYIPVGEHHALWFNVKPYKAAYCDANKNVVSAGYVNNLIEIPDDIAYIVVQFNKQSIPYASANIVTILDSAPEITKSSTFTLTKGDMIDYFDTDHFPIIQGCVCHMGKIYATSGYGEYNNTYAAGLHVIDLTEKKEVSTVDFNSFFLGEFEPEAIEVVNGQMLYGAGNKIFELKF